MHTNTELEKTGETKNAFAPIVRFRSNDSTWNALSVYDAGPAGSPPELPSRTSYGGLFTHDPDWFGLAFNEEPATTVIEVQQGRQYYISPRGTGVDMTPRLIQVTEPANQSVWILPRGESRPDTTLKLQLPPGLTNGRFERGHIQVSIEDAITGIPFFVLSDLGADELGKLWPVPPRPIRVIAKGAALHDHHHGTVMVQRQLGRIEVLIEPELGKTVTVPIGLKPGGKLRIAVTGQLLDSERPVTEEERAGRDREGRHWSEAWFTLLDAHGQEVEDVLWVGPGMLGTTARGTHLKQSWPLNKTITSEMLPLGAYTLRATLLHRTPLLIPVNVVEGTTDIAVTFP